MIARAHQLTAVAISGRALLIDGAPGAGKSSLALALIDRGAVLIGDDGVTLEIDDGALFATPHPNTQGLLEVRNVGILSFPTIQRAPVCLIIRLAPEAPRYIEWPETIDLSGVRLPLVVIDEAGLNLALKAELALDRYGLPHHSVPSKDEG